MTSEPLVSVIIPTYNRLSFLTEALESALNQTHENLEIIVVDDGSNDGTGDYVQGLGDNRITYVYLQHRGHPAPVRNVGLKMATGEFVAFLDSDDRWLPGKIEAQVRVLAEGPHFDLVATDFFEFPSRQLKPALRLKQPRAVVFRDLLRANPITNSSVVLKRSVIDSVGLLDESEAMRGLEDYEYWLRIVRNGTNSAVILPEPLLLYRRHEGNIGIQDVEQCDRLSVIVARHRDYDEAYVESVLQELQDRKAFRQALFDIDSGRTSLFRVLFRREVRLLDRFRVIKYRLRKACLLQRG